MRLLNELFSYVPAAFLAIAFALTVADWNHLVEAGGWFALLGHFLMVAATLVLISLAGALLVTLVALPLILLFCGSDDAVFAIAEARRAGPLVLARRIITRPLINGANFFLKAAWFAWWYIRENLAHDRSR